MASLPASRSCLEGAEEGNGTCEGQGEGEQEQQEQEQNPEPSQVGGSDAYMTEPDHPLYNMHCREGHEGQAAASKEGGDAGTPSESQRYVIVEASQG